MLGIEVAESTFMSLGNKYNWAYLIRRAVAWMRSIQNTSLGV